MGDVSSIDRRTVGDSRPGTLRDINTRQSHRPFRLRPPEVDGALARRRVQKILRWRFEQRVTLVTAGAGMGKSSALAIAIDENRLAPAGIDIWLGCEPSDSAPQHFLGGLSAAFGSKMELDLAGICEAAVALAPQQVCITLDDVHELSEDSFKYLGHLVHELPANCHLLLCGRTDVPIPLARLEAQHRVTRLDPALLLLSPSEVAAMYGPSAAVHGGWPALVSLAARQQSSDDFVWQEVVGALSSEQVSAIETLVAIGPATLRTLEATAGVTEESLTSLPMVTCSDGIWVAHDLWRHAIDTGHGQDRLRRRAIEHLSSEQAHEAIIDVALRSDSMGPSALASLGKVIVDRPPSMANCQRWLDHAGDLKHEAEFEYLEGLKLRARHPSSQGCIEAFQRAADGFGGRSDIEGEAAALGHVVICAHVRRDIDSMLTAFGRLEELATAGSRTAKQISAVGGALLAFAINDPAQAVEHLGKIDHTRLDAAIGSLAKRIETAALNQLGRPSVAVAMESLRLDNGLGASNEAVLWALVREGRWDEVVAQLKLRPDFHGDDERFLWVSWHAAVLAALGDIAGAKESLAEAETCRVAESWRAQVQLGLLQTMIAICVGDQTEATKIASGLAETNPIDGQASALYLSAPRIVYDCIPDGPAELERLAVGPLHHRDLRLLRALNESRAAASSNPIGDTDWVDRPGELLTSLQLDGTAEFLVRASAANRPEAGPAISWLFDIAGNHARDHIRSFSGHPELEVAKAAGHIVATVPIRPQEPRRLAFLGTSRLSIDGLPVETPQWHRERVRSLLGFLILHQSCTRDQVMTALWPDVDKTSARRNLRTTLNLVHKCLEPDRASGDAPFFVRSAGSALTLISDDRLEVDVWLFAADLDLAAELEVDGLPSAALPLLARAVKLYQGDLLGDVEEAMWIDNERHPLRRRYLAATVRMAQLHLALNQPEQAEVFARKAIGAEPWSEAGHCALIESLVNMKDRAGSVRAALQCRDALDEIGGPAEPGTVTLLSGLLPQTR